MLRLALAALMTSALFSYACGADNTHIDNNSKWTILVTTSYPGGDSEFIKRAIAPGGSDVDTYSPVAYVNLDVQVQDAEFSNHFQISSDQSVVAQDTPDNMYGVDFYLNDGDGNPQLTITDPLGLVELPGLLVTIFGPGPPPAPTQPPSPPAPESPESPSDTADEDPTIERVFGDDTRVPALQDGTAKFPNVGFLRPMKNGKNFPAGTAFLLPGNKIATSAHSLFDRADNTKLDSFELYFGQTEVGTYLEKAQGRVSDCLIPPEFVEQPFGNAREALDFALCALQSAVQNAAIQPFQLASKPPNQLPVTLIGYTFNIFYPDKFKKQFPSDGVPFMATCDALFYDGHSIPESSRRQQPEGDNFWGYTCSATAGQSGSPLIATNGGILGVHWGSYDPVVQLNMAASLVNNPDSSFPVPE